MDSSQSSFIPTKPEAELSGRLVRPFTLRYTEDALAEVSNESLSSTPAGIQLKEHKHCVLGTTKKHPYLF